MRMESAPFIALSRRKEKNPATVIETNDTSVGKENDSAIVGKHLQVPERVAPMAVLQVRNLT